MRATTLATAALATTTLAAAATPQTALRTPPPPNIVIILADDLGYADTTFTGAKDIRTPNLQRLADTGMILTNFHACPVCSPTRAGLMTGRWPLRYGLMKAVIPPWQDFGLPTDEKILPQHLAPAGYEQRHMTGKWHLGHSRLAFLPANRGFTSFYGHYNGAFDYFTHKREGEVDWHRDTPGKVTAVHEKGYSTDLIGADAVSFIQQDHGGKPYLLYVAFNAPHGPLQAKPEDLAKYDHITGGIGGAGKAGKKGKRTENERRPYAAMIDSMDQNIGRILDAIEKRPDAANTLVLFFSDNGGEAPGTRSNNLPYRDGKFSVYEGGTRVCAAIRWPAAGLSGGKTSNALTGYIDIVPTLMIAAGLPLPAADAPKTLDGIDILPILRGETPAPKRPWFSYFDQSNNPTASVIEGDWKLVVHEGDVLAPGKTAGTRCELYNITKDPHEKNDIYNKHPAEAKHLKDLLTAFGRLQSATGVPTRSEGQKGFTAPKDWIITTP